jgi:hypothetical protein
MIGYKAFNKDWTCKGFKYEIGETYETDIAVMCQKGFHFCENPINVLYYYPLADSVFAMVEALDEAFYIKGHTTKWVTTKMKVLKELSYDDFILAAIDALGRDSNKMFRYKTSKKKYGKILIDYNGTSIIVRGYSSKIAVKGRDTKIVCDADSPIVLSCGYYTDMILTGTCSRVITSGVAPNIFASGKYSTIVTTGRNSSVVATGDHSNITANGVDSKAINLGLNGYARGVKGTFITLRNFCGEDAGPKNMETKSQMIDGETLKENVFYSLQNGVFIEKREVQNG